MDSLAFEIIAQIDADMDEFTAAQKVSCLKTVISQLQEKLEVVKWEAEEEQDEHDYERSVSSDMDEEDDDE